jgi:hypothetical protein
MPDFVGPSYRLQVRRADVQRSVNLMPVVSDSPGAKASVYLDSVPGLREFSPGVTEYGALLQENGAYVLKEDGGFIILEGQ